MKNELVFGASSPVSQCHASTVPALPGDRFIMACFGGSREGHRDVGIWGAIRTAGKWSAPQLMEKVKSIPIVRN